MIFLLLLILPLGLLTKKILAQSFESNSYYIQMGNFNMTGGRKTSLNYTLTDTAGQTFQGQFDSSGYVTKAGFQYIHDLGLFSFSISDLSIDFGSLTIESLTTDQNTLSVTSVGASGYQVLAYETNPLRRQITSTDIPDTTCDDTTCDESTCRPWTSTSAYGFGFNMTGNDVDTSSGKFEDPTYFCQFADDESSETPQPVMLSDNVGTGRTASVTYQVNISTLQEAGDYATEIVFLAVPGY